MKTDNTELLHVQKRLLLWGKKLKELLEKSNKKFVVLLMPPQEWRDCGFDWVGHWSDDYLKTVAWVAFRLDEEELYVYPTGTTPNELFGKSKDFIPYRDRKRFADAVMKLNDNSSFEGLFDDDGIFQVESAFLFDADNDVEYPLNYVDYCIEALIGKRNAVLIVGNNERLEDATDFYLSEYNAYKTLEEDVAQLAKEL
jgi:hypothetical protein